ncbi:vomeronasal type-2 receptor 26-like [Pleurodeles waltl]|uniref:vomeronasal type-2 receptor 26-like n=1 Tax=Pleurodeles waltl TaxID=8319 RepID=UPI0037094CE5
MEVFHEGSTGVLARPSMHFPASPDSPRALLHYIKQTHFKTPIGTELSFDRYGNPLARYDVVNWQLGPEGTIRHVTVGTYDANAPPMKNLVLNESAIFWAASNSAQGEISAVTDSAECVRCPWDKWPNARQDQCYQRAEEFLGFEEALGAILAVMSISFSLMPCCILQLFMNHRNTPVVKANNRTLSYLLLLSLTFCFLCSLIFIGYPTQVKCLFRQITFGIIFSLCISCILAKTIMVVIAFSATKPKSDLRRWVGPWLSYLIICVCTLIQICICVSWLAISPPFSYFNTHTRPGKLIIECNEGSVIAFWCMLGYLGFLATVCFLIAFLARKLPDSFNEAKCITFSMLAFLSLWVSFIPAYLSTRGKYMVALEIFTILSSSAAVFSCIFFPKCYIILLRPEMNTRKNVMGRKLG